MFLDSLISQFGLFDLVFLVGVAGGAVYYLMFRNKSEAPSFKPLTTNPGLKSSISTDRSFISRMKNGNRNIVVFFGSQTGTAEEFAGRLAKESYRFGMKAITADPEECDMEDLCRLPEIDNSLAVFIMATYGEGDPTDNAHELYDWLQQGESELNGIRYTVFGLGNKTYEHYNAIAKYMDTRLEELGGQRILELGLGDDDANIEEDFITWKDKFWPGICEFFGVSEVAEEVNIRQYLLRVHGEEIQREKIFKGEPCRLNSLINQRPPFDMKNPFMATIFKKRELHTGGDRSCLHVEVDISNSKLRYECGDHIAIFPANKMELVEQLASRLDADLDVVFTLTNVDEEATKKHPFPCPTTYRIALTHYLDITSIPRTNILKELSEYAQNPEEKDFLISLTKATPESKASYLDWIVSSHRTIVHILQDLPSLQPPIDHICELLPKLQPRYYSISSSPRVQPSCVSITAVIVDYQTSTNRRIEGVATGMIRSLEPMEGLFPRVPIFIRKSQFRLPFKPSLPVIMIGPGTGLAPFRGFLQDRAVLKREGKPIGDMVLYFGCRKKTEDFIYSEELTSYVEEGVLTKLYTAFSREQEEKVYVQHIIARHGEEIWNLLERKAHLYVCGDARNMAHDVDLTLQSIIMKHGNLDSASTQDYLKRLRTNGRYSCDVWS